MRWPRALARSAGLALLLGVTVAGCGSPSAPVTSNTPNTGGSSPSAGSPTSTADLVYAEQYRSIIGPCNESEKALSTITSSTTKFTANAIGAHVADVCHGALVAMMQAHWPPNVEVDIKALNAASAPLINDLRHLVARFGHVRADGAKVNVAADKVRADVGLPPVGS